MKMRQRRKRARRAKSSFTWQERHALNDLLRSFKDMRAMASSMKNRGLPKPAGETVVWRPRPYVGG